MVQLVENLPYKCEKLSTNLWHSCEDGGKRQTESPETHRQVRLEYTKAGQEIYPTLNKMKVKDQCPRLSSDLHICSK